MTTDVLNNADFESQVLKALAWLKSLKYAGAKLNADAYHVKHAVEEAYGHSVYIPKEALIEAARRAGFLARNEVIKINYVI